MRIPVKVVVGVRFPLMKRKNFGLVNSTKMKDIREVPLIKDQN